jgi:hypothetical protein
LAKPAEIEKALIKPGRGNPIASSSAFLRCVIAWNDSATLLILIVHFPSIPIVPEAAEEEFGNG